MSGDLFLSDPSKGRKRSRGKDRGSRKSSKQRREDIPTNEHDEVISGESDSEGSNSGDLNDDVDEGFSSEEEFLEESVADKRRRLAKQYLENLRNEEGFGDDDDFDAKDLDDDILSRRLQRDVAENKGHIYKLISDRINSQMDEISTSVTRVGSKDLTDLAICYPYLYTVSKDVELIKWDISSENRKPKRIRHKKGGRHHLNLEKATHLNHHADVINCVAATSDGKYIVTGGIDGRLIIWSSESLSCLKVFETRSSVNAISIRRGTDQLFAACSDLRVRTFSINQFSQLEILYGHQDSIADISSLSRETCVTVGSRDKMAMFWKIAEETHLTFRGGDRIEKVSKKKKTDKEESGPEIFMEGSMDVVSMADESHFVTGSDNGSISLWSLAKKKSLMTERVAHGLEAQNSAQQSSAESSLEKASVQIAKPQPYWITAIHAVPFSDLFVSGSYSGTINIWKISSQGFRSFELVGKINDIKGCIVKIDSVETKDKKLKIFVLTSKEHKFGRWFSKIKGARNALITFTFDI